MPLRLLSSLMKMPPVLIVKEFLRPFFLSQIITERIVEYPFVFQQLSLPKGSRVLEVGCAYSLLSVQLASLGYEVYGIDLEHYSYSHANLRTRVVDIRESGFPNEYFDGIVAVSTIEHIGLPYSFRKSRVLRTPLDKQGDFRAVEEIHRILRPSGIFILTVPFDKEFIQTQTHRIYDQDRVTRLLRTFRVDTLEVFVRIARDFVQKLPAEVQSLPKNVSGEVRAVALIKAVKLGIS